MLSIVLDRDKLERILSNNFDSVLAKNLIDFYKKLKETQFLGKFEECQINCGKFVEIMIRILEFLNGGQYTALNKLVKLDNKLVNQLESNTKLYDSMRFHIPKILKTIYDIRNKRGVAHVGEINPNIMDSTYVVTACDWILAECVRIYYADDLKTVKNIIKSIIETKIPIIEEFGEDLLVLEPNPTSLSVSSKILLILYHKHPDRMSIQNIKKWIKTRSKSHIMTALKQLEEKTNIFRRGNEIYITKRGIMYIENKILAKLEQF